MTAVASGPTADTLRNTNICFFSLLPINKIIIDTEPVFIAKNKNMRCFSKKNVCCLVGRRLWWWWEWFRDCALQPCRSWSRSHYTAFWPVRYQANNIHTLPSHLNSNCCNHRLFLLCNVYLAYLSIFFSLQFLDIILERRIFLSLTCVNMSNFIL